MAALFSSQQIVARLRQYSSLFRSAQLRNAIEDLCVEWFHVEDPVAVVGAFHPSEPVSQQRMRRIPDREIAIPADRCRKDFHHLAGRRADLERVIGGDGPAWRFERDSQALGKIISRDASAVKPPCS